MDERRSSSELKVSDNETFNKIQDRYSIIIEQTNLFIYDLNLINNEIYVSDNFIKMTGVPFKKQAILKQMICYKNIHPDDLDSFKSFLKYGKDGSNSHSITYRRRNPDGRYAWIRSSKKSIFNEYGKIIRVLGTAQDVSAEMEAFEKIKNRAEKDALTDIPNLLKFTADAEELIRTNRDKSYAVVVFDIDKFRIINDLYGSKEGDGVLKYIGYILKNKISQNFLYCRMYADNFAILMQYNKDSDFGYIADLLGEEVKQYPLKLGVMLSFGVCKAEDDTDIITLCDRASLAKKTIKGNVLELVAYYDETLRQRGIEDKDIENEMNLALENGEFEIYLQPKVLIATTEVIGAEALVRWVHPSKGIISPERFIPLFEKNGFIIKLDYLVWEMAFVTLRKWLDEGFEPIPISVNVSRLHIHNADIVQKFIMLAEKYKVPRNLIELELTETAFLNNLDELSYLAHNLKKEGFILSMDDFGTGYSSLNMLKDVPVDVIKIDRGFLNEIVTTERGKTVIQYTIAMAKKLNIEVIAEGVENFVQAKFLYEAGCETAQGYFYSKPIPVPKFEQYTFGYIDN
ncbi:bifunctional diguanylate cyclase/phosphodiesterase [Anaerocolumna sp. MB42-C2]|uniref:bifunctional diguanylate cyclase/phosphodiesterase n=1 Tax=Anaerocolumna sp. MB42-C2 TaxID=3070997 RepID=UPI0027DEBDCD|nr:GGDEF and EAL domain-containing protein [Anaerocolumna sp. MB42-C2]WMJ90480.1 GGDEF and EAL domain-containing protein [Anaerocolumna sp. MB42-C2]